ncbi:MAG TPA: protein-methionine-sulfoxide reductase heme-binding subunit MsrQ [Elusimicrobiota bacterium]|nr:protein-methionine-sulfoxide reductase heme-binding subunit MsrQ [Elusimicrobiota bacterium]
MKTFLWLALCSAPGLDLAYKAKTGHLGANPVSTLLHECGSWALNFLMITLAARPLTRLTGWAWPMRRRRMLGLFAAFYATAHFTVYLVLDRELALGEISKDLTKRPYIVMGFLAWLLMVPLAVTSTDGMVRRLGRRWGKLHRLVYASALAGIIHFLWLVKSDRTEPLTYLAGFAALMGWRLWAARRPLVYGSVTN